MKRLVIFAVLVIGAFRLAQDEWTLHQQRWTIWYSWDIIRMQSLAIHQQGETVALAQKSLIMCDVRGEPGPFKIVHNRSAK